MRLAREPRIDWFFRWNTNLLTVNEEEAWKGREKCADQSKSEEPPITGQ